MGEIVMLVFETCNLPMNQRELGSKPSQVLSSLCGLGQTP